MRGLRCYSRAPDAREAGHVGNPLTVGDSSQALLVSATPLLCVNVTGDLR
jgi:hypothetical protein